jgi:hypothetical protein
VNEDEDNGQRTVEQTMVSRNMNAYSEEGLFSTNKYIENASVSNSKPKYRCFLTNSENSILKKYSFSEIPNNAG